MLGFLFELQILNKVFPGDLDTAQPSAKLPAFQHAILERYHGSLVDDLLAICVQEPK